MSDFRDPLYRDPNNPTSSNIGYEPAAGRNAGWGWIAGAVFLVVVLAIAFGVGHTPNARVASNNASPAITHPLAAPLAANPAPGLTPPPAAAPAAKPNQ